MENSKPLVVFEQKPFKFLIVKSHSTSIMLNFMYVHIIGLFAVVMNVVKLR